MRSTLALVLSAAVALISAPASAGELYGGVYTHGARIGITVCCYEPGPDLEIGVMSDRWQALSKYGDFRLYGLGSVNTRGGVDFAAAGLAWRIPLGHRFYLQPGIGGAVQTGPAVGHQARPDKLYLGSRFLVEPQGSLGYQISPRWAVEASYVHLSHAQLAGPQNPGLDDLGVRLAWRF